MAKTALRFQVLADIASSPVVSVTAISFADELMMRPCRCPAGE
jgi:hypothetical protein